MKIAFRRRLARRMSENSRSSCRAKVRANLTSTFCPYSTFRHRSLIKMRPMRMWLEYIRHIIHRIMVRSWPGGSCLGCIQACHFDLSHECDCNRQRFSHHSFIFSPDLLHAHVPARTGDAGANRICFYIRPKSCEKRIQRSDVRLPISSLL